MFAALGVGVRGGPRLVRGTEVPAVDEPRRLQRDPPHEDERKKKKERSQPDDEKHERAGEAKVRTRGGDEGVPRMRGGPARNPRQAWVGWGPARGVTPPEEPPIHRPAAGG